MHRHPNKTEQQKHQHAKFKAQTFFNQIKPEDWLIPNTSLMNSSFWTPNLKPQKIMVVAQWRTGSTFTSELFNRHPDVFYQFEPLMTMRDHEAHTGEAVLNFNKTVLEKANRILTNFYENCVFSRPPIIPKNLPKEDGVYFKYKTGALMRPPFCLDRQDNYYRRGFLC